MNSIINYIKINDRLSTAGQPTKEQFKKISKEGFDVVINLTTKGKKALRNEDKIVSKNGMDYIHIPIEWNDPIEDKFKLL